MAAESWREFYASDLQAVWSLVALPAVFLAWLLARGRAVAARDADPRGTFVHAWALVFALETILDPIATGPLSRAAELSPAAARMCGLVFVLLGDFRVWLLVAALVLGPGRRAAVFAGSALGTAVVPLAAFGVDAALRQRWPELPDQSLWLVYELGFAGLALWVRARGLARIASTAAAHAAGDDARALRAARAVLAYAVAYYALWAAADVAILAGTDAGWALRVVPNQLYYSLFVPFAFFAWFARGRSAPARAA